jgi:hypothetical protein
MPRNRNARSIPQYVSLSVACYSSISIHHHSRSPWFQYQLSALSPPQALIAQTEVREAHPVPLLLASRQNPSRKSTPTDTTRTIHRLPSARFQVLPWTSLLLNVAGNPPQSGKRSRRVAHMVCKRHLRIDQPKKTGETLSSIYGKSHPKRRSLAYARLSPPILGTQDLQSIQRYDSLTHHSAF